MIVAIVKIGRKICLCIFHQSLDFTLWSSQQIQIQIANDGLVQVGHTKSFAFAHVAMSHKFKTSHILTLLLIAFLNKFEFLGNEHTKEPI